MIAVLLTAGLLNLCTQERVTEGPNWDDALPVQFTVSIPGEDSGSRALTTAEESSVTSVNVLAFYLSGSDYIYAYAPTFISSNTLGNQMTVTVNVKASDLVQQFVILVNASAELASAGIQPNDRLSDAMDKVISTGNGEWPARKNGTGPFKAIPMYAKSVAQVVAANTTIPTIGNYPLIRMVAKIDVSLKSTITSSKFVLTEGMLFNYQKGGYVSYEHSSFNGIDEALAAAVPASGLNPGDPILEPTTPYCTAVGGALVQMLYTYESPAYTEANKLKGTALVVGGKYNGSTTMSYYRINIKTTTEPAANYSSPILRNHQYNVVIQDVTGPGYSTPIEAYRGDAERMTAQVEAWNLMNRDYPIGQDQGPYSLVVNSEAFAIPKAGGTAQLLITSTNSANWNIGTITYSSGTGWLAVSPLSAGPGTNTQVNLVVSAANAGTTNRTATFIITVGNMHKTITVTQSGT